jgi:hypothetical protein
VIVIVIVDRLRRGSWTSCAGFVIVSVCAGDREPATPDFVIVIGLAEIVNRPAAGFRDRDRSPSTIPGAAGSRSPPEGRSTIPGAAGSRSRARRAAFTIPARRAVHDHDHDHVSSFQRHLEPPQKLLQLRLRRGSPFF